MAVVDVDDVSIDGNWECDIAATGFAAIPYRERERSR